MKNNIFKIKYEAIRKDVKYDDKTFAFASLTHREKVNCAKQFLKAIVLRVGCSDYLFTLCITELHERYGKSIVPVLWEILDTYCAYSEKIDDDISCDMAFAAFYCLVHHYYRQLDAENLRKLLLPKDDWVRRFVDDDNAYSQRLNFTAVSECDYNKFFADYPLIFELLARYYSVRGDYNSQLKMARTALKKLPLTEDKIIRYTGEEPYVQQGVNYGVEISCAGAVCSILEDNYLYGVLSDKPKFSFAEQSKYLVTAIASYYSVEESDLSWVRELISGDNLNVTERYVDGAMEFAANVLGADYPKYHYLKAKIIFYREVIYNYLHGNRRRELRFQSEIKEEIDKAVELETSRGAYDADKRTFTYNCLKEYVDRYTNANLDKRYHKNRKQVISAADKQKLNDKYYPKLIDKSGSDYLFISYSAVDFKQVFCDLHEMDRMGISYWYDRGTRVGIDWKEIIHQRIRGCSAVLYYMSSPSITSPAVMDELNYILQFNKPIICINLCGNSVTSRTLINVIRGGTENTFNSITSNTFKTICSACPDYIVTLQRDKDPLNVYHIKKLRADLLKTFPSVIRYVWSESKSTGSDKTFKDKNGNVAKRPNEDFIIHDELNKIYIVADGISRSDEEYKRYINDGNSKSIAGMVSEVFCTALHESIKETILDAQSEENLERDFENAFQTANRKVEEFLRRRTDYLRSGRYDVTPYYEKPGCVAVAAFIYGDRLYYGSVGDCMGILYRGDRRIIFSDKQTDYAFNELQIEKDRQKLYSEFVNKPHNPYGYGVVNGEENAAAFFSAAHLDLEPGDEIYIVSDGISDLIKYGNMSSVSRSKIDKLFETEDKRRADLGQKTDDKSLIRIRIS